MKDKISVKVTAEKLYRRKMLMKLATIAISVILLFVSVVYSVLYVVNRTGNFTISLDPNLKTEYKITMSPYSDFSVTDIFLSAKALDYMDNITESWLPEDIDEKEGEHSQDNYIAYTFFLKNEGEKTINYKSAINIQSVIKDVDEAVRVAVFYNGEKTVYAKWQKGTKEPEPNTTPFLSNVKIMENKVKDFDVNDVDRYTIVIWLEGNDPECVNDILGGEMKMLMTIRKTD